MFGNRKTDELDNLWDAYMYHGELEPSENFKLIHKEFNDFFKALKTRKIISESKYLEIDEKFGAIISEAENQAFRKGFTKGLDLRNAVVNEREKTGLNVTCNKNELDFIFNIQHTFTNSQKKLLFEILKNYKSNQG